jgi:hypothetical protein
MTDIDILVTKVRTGGQQMIRADVKGAQGGGTWMNLSLFGKDSIAVCREHAAEYTAIADELEKLKAQGVNW